MYYIFSVIDHDTNDLVEIKLQEISKPVTDSLNLLSKVGGSCPTQLTADFTATTIHGSVRCYYPIQSDGNQIVAIKSGDHQVEYEIQVSQVENNISMTDGLVYCSLSKQDYINYFYIDIIGDMNFVLNVNGLQTTVFLAKNRFPTFTSYDIIDVNNSANSRNISINQCNYPFITMSGRWYIGLYRNSVPSPIYIQASYQQSRNCNESKTTTSTGGVCNLENAFKCDDSFASCLLHSDTCYCYEIYGFCLVNTLCESDNRFSIFQVDCLGQKCTNAQCLVPMLSASISLYSIFQPQLYLYLTIMYLLL